MLLHSETVTTKKGNKMISYHVRGSIIWLNYYVEGKRIRKSTKLRNTPQNLNIVKNQIIPSLIQKIESGDIYKKKPKTFEYYGDIYLKEKENNKSYMDKLGKFLSIIDFFKGRDIDTITRLDIKKYLYDLPMKSKSKNTYKSCIKEIFEFACDDGVLSYNPAIAIRLKPDVKEDIQYYSRNEVNRLLSVATGVMKPYLHVAYNTGMRVGEVLGLQLGDFKEDGFIHIKRTRTKGIIGDGKTNNAQRKVPYSKEMLEIVREFQSDNIFIFGRYDCASKFKRRWAKVVKDAEIPHYKMSCSRHTFATLMLRECIVSINELSGLLGHAKAKTTLECYASVIKADNINLGKNFSLFGHNMVTIENKKEVLALK